MAKLARKAVFLLSSWLAPSVKARKKGMFPKGSTIKKMSDRETMANSSVGYIGQAMGKGLWAIDQIPFLSMGICQMRQFRMAMNGEEGSGTLEEMNDPLALSPGKGERARMEATDRV